MKYERYTLGRLATIKKVKGQPLDKYPIGNIPYVTGSQSNNGVVGFVNAPDSSISEGNCIVIDPIKGLCMYQPDRFVGRGFSGASVNALYIEGLNELNALYIIASISAYSTKVASYGNLFNSNRLSNAEIILPTLDTVDMHSTYSDNGYIPDFAYMEQYITELEQQCIAELDQYLIVSGLNDCELTEEDKAVLAMKGTKPTKEFKVDDLFNISTIKQAKSQSLIPTDDQGVPYIVQSTRNNMCCRNVNEQWLIDHNESPVDGNCIVLGVTLPAISYQPDKFGASQVIIARANFLNEHIGIYCAELFKKQMNRFSYSAKPSIKAYKETLLPLPIQTDHNNIPFKDPFCQYHSKGYVPDWRFVENYIKAIKKVIIKDAVSWKNSIFY